MNEDIIKGKWKKLQGKVQTQWGKLTDDEVHKMKGSAQELEGILQEKYGYNKEKAKEEVDGFVKKYDTDKHDH